MIQTVLGEVPSDKLGRVLTHEHVVSLYGDWNNLSDRPRAGWREAALAHYTPLLAELKRSHDVGTIVEVTPGWESRGPEDLELWAEISRRSGVNLVLSTGDFMGSDLGLLGRERGDQSAAQMADKMVAEASGGICGTRVRAGIIKVHARRDTDYGRRLIKAAAIAQKETGLSLTTCTGDHRFYLDVWLMEGVRPERLCFSHAEAYRSMPEVIEFFKRGCSYNMTLWGVRAARATWLPKPVVPEFYSAAFVAALVAEGFTDRIFPSIDYSAMGGFTEDGKVNGDLYGQPGRTYLYAFTHAVPNMRRFGVSEEDIEVMLRDNPRRLLEPS